MSKKIYIKIDKPIEVGDLVRCVEHDGEYKPGDIRKVSRLDTTNKIFFYVHGSGMPRWQGCWEPVRKEASVNENRRAEMKRAVAEMIVELLDQETEISLGAYYDIGLTMVETVETLGNQSIGEAELHPNDKWDTLTGIYVALSKATGRKLPNWIYCGKMREVRLEIVGDWASEETRKREHKASDIRLLSDALIELKKMVEKQIPKKPLHVHRNYYCPICKEDSWIMWDDAVPNGTDNYCPMCGQAINWEEEI